MELFHQMLFWENERPENGTVHHLAVLCYHLQHPSLYSPEGLAHALGLLAAFVEHGASTDTVLQQSRRSLDSGRRTWKITARPGQAGAYPTPPRWTMTAFDVIAGGIENYPETVRAWARSIWQALNL